MFRSSLVFFKRACTKWHKSSMPSLLLPNMQEDLFSFDLDDYHHHQQSFETTPTFDFSSWINPEYIPSPSTDPFYPFDFTVPFPASSPDDVPSLSPSTTTTMSPEWPTQEWVDPAPSWVSGLFDAPSPSVSPPMTTARRLSPDATQRVRINSSSARRPSITSPTLFQSSSAPSYSHIQTRASSSMASRRAESVSLSSIDVDRDATLRVRRRKASSSSVSAEDSDSKPDHRESAPTRSTLKPPKLAPSAWQLYFTDWIQRQQAMNTRKLNVAQAAKEAGQEYASLSPAEKEPYKRRSQQMKEAREREHSAYMRTLTPDDIKRENAFRTAQRKAGKSRKSNIKDPNAPKKPLSAYFMFLQRIRSDPVLVREVFGEETETTKQSVLAAARWRSMTDDERKPFLAQAEQEKMEYETARRLYEEGTTGYGTAISFSILPGGSPISNYVPIVKSESSASTSESEGEGFQKSL